METIGGILLVLSLLFNYGQHKQVEGLKEDVEVLTEQRDQAKTVAEANAAAVDELKQVAEHNGVVSRGLGADLNSCAQKLRSFEASIAVFDQRRQADALAIDELEKRLAVSDMDSCSVPPWLVERYAGDTD